MLLGRKSVRAGLPGARWKGLPLQIDYNAYNYMVLTVKTRPRSFGLVFFLLFPYEMDIRLTLLSIGAILSPGSREGNEDHEMSQVSF